jgi:hypothetical protein
VLLVEQQVEVVDVGERVDVGLRELMAVVVVDLHWQFATNFEGLQYSVVLVWASCYSKLDHAHGSRLGGVAVVGSY